MLHAVAEKVLTAHGDRVLVGIDGRSGTGKSTFADELTRVLEGRGRDVIRSTTDSFHRPREERLRRGATSAKGFYVDSHQLDRIVNELLIPFRDGAGHVITAVFDEPTDRALEIDRRLYLARWPRYRHGWTSYVDDVDPASQATIVIDNHDIARPVVLAHR